MRWLLLPRKKRSVSRECLYERTIYQDIYQLQQFQLGRILHQVLKLIAREAPDGLVALLADGTSQLGKALCLKHRVASREGDVGEGVAP